MDRRHLSPLELLDASMQHAYCADYLLRHMDLEELQRGDGIDALTPVVSLLYHAFQLLLKAYCLHNSHSIKEHKSLVQLAEINAHLGLSQQDMLLLKTLSRQYAVHKGIEYNLWDDQQQLHVFCATLLPLYERVQNMMPLELQADYNS